MATKTNSICTNNQEIDIQSTAAAINIGTNLTSTKTLSLGNSTALQVTLRGSGSYLSVGEYSTSGTSGLSTTNQNIFLDPGTAFLSLRGGTVQIGTTPASNAITVGSATSTITVQSFTNYGVVGTSSSGVLSDIAATTSGYVLTSNGTGSLPSWQAASAGGITWVNVTGATQAMAINTAYISNDTSTLVTLTLPATAAIGSVVQVQGAGSGLYTIAQNASQVINFNQLASTTGTGGSVSSTSQFDSITLVCITANTTWAVNQSVGTFSVV